MDGHGCRPEADRAGERLGRIRRRSTFTSLQASRIRSRSGPVRIAAVGGGDFDRPCVAFSVSRKVGGAVVRNRLRRRLRAITVENISRLRPGAYLITLSVQTANLSYRELRENVNTAFAALIQEEWG